jgi:DNA-binding CsgD family transcriptional regulator
MHAPPLTRRLVSPKGAYGPQESPTATRGSVLRHLAAARLRELRREGLGRREIAERLARDGDRSGAGPAEGRLDAALLLRGAGRPDAEASLRAAIDSFAEPLALHDGSRGILHANRLLVRQLRDGGRGEALEREIDHVARTTVGLMLLREPEGDDDVHEGVVEREVPFSDRPVRLTATYIGRRTMERCPAVLVVLEELTLEPISDARLRRHFGLTPKQARIARLAALGASNAEIAAHFSLSPHTVRHHVSAILRRLGVRSRSALASTIFRGAAVNVRRSGPRGRAGGASDGDPRWADRPM